MKDNPFLDSQIFIFDDVLKNVRKDQAKKISRGLKKKKKKKKRSDFEFAFIP